jgi:protein involved in polysaccharide export with SLBB domain
MTKRGFHVLLAALLATVAWTAPAEAQQVPDEVRQQLEERGMTVQEARQRARELGIDLSNPQQAARRARELGIPESQIQALLQAARGGGAAEASGTGLQAGGQRRRGLRRTAAPEYPVLGGTPTIDPDTVSVRQLPQRVRVRIPLRSNASIVRVEAFLQGAQADTATQASDTSSVTGLRRLRGGQRDGVWGGSFRIERGASAGVRSLFVEASTLDTTVTINTGRVHRLFRAGAIPQALLQREFQDDGRMAGRDSLRYFGYDTFNTIPEAFLPTASGPVGDGYIVGPNDEMRLVVWGGAEFQYTLQVDREGRVTVPNVGQFTVAGKKVSVLEEEMRQWLSQSYSGLTADPPTVFMDLTVTRVRPVQVYVLGEVNQPGGYTVSSFATAFNALYSVGGPKRSGSLRRIRVVRDGAVVDTVDLYDYLLQSRSPDPVQLQAGDFIRVPPRGKTVAIDGPVKRPAYYELKEGETFQDLLQFAGGLKPEAYAKRFQVEHVVPFDERDDPSVAREVQDYSLVAARSGSTRVAMADGDRVEILSIREVGDQALKPRIRAAKVSGAVFQPGRYEIGDDVRTVRDLIERADGLVSDAYRPRAELYRLQEDLQRSMRTLDLEAVMNDAPTANVVLRPGDSLHVDSRRAFRAPRYVRISGQVRAPGRYRYREDMTLQDLLFKGGGLNDDEYLKRVFKERADLYRESDDGREVRGIPFHLGDALRGQGMANRPLQPGDSVRVYPIRVEQVEDRFVTIQGAVKTTGRFQYTDDMTLKDALVRAEGFAERASPRVEITRATTNAEGREQAETIRLSLAEDGLAASEVELGVRDTSEAMKTADTFGLQHRDRIYVRPDPSFKVQEVVTVSGEVRYPGQYTILRDDERLSDVVERAGGILPTGYPQGGRLVRDGEQVIINFAEALEGDEDSDVILQPQDEISIPRRPNTVTIAGNVANEGKVKHASGKRVDYYLQRAGGTRDNTEAIYLTQANGATFRVKTGWFRRTPQVQDGALIRVVGESEEEGQRTFQQVSQTVTQSLGILSSALTVIALAGRAL